MKKLRKYISLPSSILIITALVSGAIYAAFRINGNFAEFFNSHISPVFRWIYTHVSDLVPFSITEFFIFFSPVLIVYLFIAVLNGRKKGDGSDVRVLTSLIAVCAFVISSFVLVYSPAYFGLSLEEKLGLDSSDITEEELADVMSRITDEINTLCESNSFPTTKTGATLMPDGFSSTVAKIESSYYRLNEEYPFLQKLHTTAKPIILSPLMTYTHISGIYSYYTGEVNINTNYPDYIVTSTIAHEMAHQRGVAKEDEANFTAFLVLINSDDDYLKYSGYLDVYVTVGNELASTDKEQYRAIYSTLCTKAKNELNAYSDFFDKYRENKANDISEAFNDAYLKSQGTEGSVSYDLVTRLVVAYYRES